LTVNKITKSNIQKYIKVNLRTLLMLALFLVLGAAGVSQAGPQPAPAVPARQPLPSTVPANPPNQKAVEPAPTKIIRVYRGEGYFDNALAEKLRPVLTGKSEPVPGHGSSARTDSSRASLGGGDGSKRE
jgi:hypothetical protein